MKVASAGEPETVPPALQSYDRSPLEVRAQMDCVHSFHRRARIEPLSRRHGATGRARLLPSRARASARPTPCAPTPPQDDPHHDTTGLARDAQPRPENRTPVREAIAALRPAP